MIRLSGSSYKYYLKWVGALGILGLTCYPIIISPMIDPKGYQEFQKISRKDIDQEKVQPGNMKIWSDPFERKKNR